MEDGDNEDEFDCLEYNYDEEDFSWYTEVIKEQTYFVLVNCEGKSFKKGE
jgi:hypothetical protein